MTKTCSVDGCDRNIAHREWCGSHYRRWLRHGDPLGGGTSIGEVSRYLKEVVLEYDGDECLDWPYATDSAGYAQIRIDRKTRRVCRIVCEDVNGPPADVSLDAAHSCGRGHFGCVARRHLSWKTRSENIADMVLHGTSSRGERNGSAKLTEDAVRDIRRRAPTTPYADLAAQYGVCLATIDQVVSRRIWGWL